jgi:hypothetical protein
MFVSLHNVLIDDHDLIWADIRFELVRKSDLNEYKNYFPVRSTKSQFPVHQRKGRKYPRTPLPPHTLVILDPFWKAVECGGNNLYNLNRKLLLLTLATIWEGSIFLCKYAFYCFYKRSQILVVIHILFDIYIFENQGPPPCFCNHVLIKY